MKTTRRSFLGLLASGIAAVTAGLPWRSKPREPVTWKLLRHYDVTYTQPPHDEAYGLPQYVGTQLIGPDGKIRGPEGYKEIRKGDCLAEAKWMCGKHWFDVGHHIATGDVRFINNGRGECYAANVIIRDSYGDLEFERDLLCDFLVRQDAVRDKPVEGGDAQDTTYQLHEGHSAPDGGVLAWSYIPSKTQAIRSRS